METNYGQRCCDYRNAPICGMAFVEREMQACNGIDYFCNLIVRWLPGCQRSL
jgi:hypothetical protein